jgi:hypothetical protein
MTCEHCGERWVTPMDYPEFGICDECLQWQDLEGAVARDHEQFYRIQPITSLVELESELGQE